MLQAEKRFGSKVESNDMSAMTLNYYESTNRDETLTTEEESNAAKTTARYASWCFPYFLPSARAAFCSLSFLGTDVI
jgi:hypothetical protein